MVQARKHSTSKERQAAYRARLRAAQGDPLTLPAAAGPSSMPSTARWRTGLDKAARLMQVVGQEMQTYSDQRTERWHDGESAERFHECLDRVVDLHDQIDDLRSDF